MEELDCVPTPRFSFFVFQMFLCFYFFLIKHPLGGKLFTLAPLIWFFFSHLSFFFFYKVQSLVVLVFVFYNVFLSCLIFFKITKKAFTRCHLIYCVGYNISFESCQFFFFLSFWNEHIPIHCSIVESLGFLLCVWHNPKNRQLVAAQEYNLKSWTWVSSVVLLDAKQNL